MNDKRGWYLGVSALAIYVIGGLGAFAGIAMIVLMPGVPLLHWGEGRAIGYLFLCVGLALTVLGVLLMRILRNRQLA